MTQLYSSNAGGRSIDQEDVDADKRARRAKMPKKKVLTKDEKGGWYMREEGTEEDKVGAANKQDEDQAALADKLAKGVDVSKFSEPEPMKPAGDAGLSAIADYTKKKREWDKRRAAWLAGQTTGAATTTTPKK